MKKLTSLLLCIMLVMSVMPVAFAEGEWTGSGTEGDPYVISDYAGFINFVESVNSGNNYAGTYFKLDTDIDLNNQNLQIGRKVWDTNEAYFSGVFDGNNHSINNFYYVDDDAGEALFACVIGSEGNNAVVKNLTVNGYAGGCKWLAGIAAYTDFADIINCTSNVNLECFNLWEHKGGIVGEANHSNITGCTNNGNLTLHGSKQNNGGIVGLSNGSTISDCVNNGDIDLGTPYSGSDACMGGIVGNNGWGTSVIRCINNGDITASQDSGNSRFIGGIVGQSTYHLTISQCVNTGSITANPGIWDNAGILGKSDAKNWGDWAGVYDSYNVGTLNGVSGGAVGWSSKYFTIENSYSLSTGYVNGPLVAGMDSNNVNVNNSYVLAEPTNWATQTTEAALTDGTLVELLNAGRTGDEAPWVQGAQRPELKCFAVTEDVVTSAEITAVDGATVTYTVTLADEDAVVLVALYSGDYLVAVKTVDAAETSATLSTATGADKAKIFVWESLTSAKPIVVSDEYSIGQ